MTSRARGTRRELANRPRNSGNPQCPGSFKGGVKAGEMTSHGGTLKRLIFLAPFQRLPDDFVLIRAGEMPQKSLANFLVNEHGECTALHAPTCVQLDRKMTVIDTALKRRRVPHFRKYYRRKMNSKGF